MSRYYSPDGESITREQWSEMFERRLSGDDAWWRKQTRVGDTDVSTVWLGLDHNYSGGEPLFWETMTFPHVTEGSYIEDYCNRYSSREEALADHDRVVESLRSGVPVAEAESRAT